MKAALMRATLQVMIFLKSFNLNLIEMKKFISAALVVAMTAASCVNKEDLGTDTQYPSVDGSMTFSAEFAKNIAVKAAPEYNADTRSVTVLWEAGDKVGVYDKDGAPVEYAADAAGASTTLTGAALQAAATYYAMYPYDAEAAIAGGVISTALPAVQPAQVDEFAAHLAVASATGRSFSFQNVCGLVRVNVTCGHVTKIEFKGNAGETVAGDINVNAATAEFANGAAQEKTVTVTPPAGSETFEAGAYYFSVLPQTFAEGFTVTSYTADGNKEVRVVNSKVVIPRSSLVVGKAFTDITGTGAENDPFVIRNIHDLCNLSGVLDASAPNYVKLAADIDMSSVQTWTPINNDRTVANIREVHFDGQNHTISNFAPATVTAGAGGDQASFFGILYGSCRNLNMTDVNLIQTAMSTTASICGFAGYAGRGDVVTKFENVHVSGAVKGKKVVAGFAANINSSEFKNCSAAVSVVASDNHVGGFVGRASGGDNSFESCYATGSVENTKSNGRYLGGFYGGDEAYSGAKMTFSKCYATGNIKCSYQAAAFVGYFDAGTYEITDCYATGSNTAFGTSKQYGGLVAVNKGNLTITNCYYAGTVTSNKAESVGGILGLGAAGNVVITNSFAIADLTSPTYGVGGVVGYNKGTGLSIENCYAAGMLSAVSGMGGIIGKTDTAASVKNSVWGGTGSEAFVGEGDATVEGTSLLSSLPAADQAAFATPSAIAVKYNWSTDIWDLSGNAPVLK